MDQISNDEGKKIDPSIGVMTILYTKKIYKMCHS
jgi:hypothetical protein